MHVVTLFLHDAFALCAVVSIFIYADHKIFRNTPIYDRACLIYLDLLSSSRQESFDPQPQTFIAIHLCKIIQ